MGVLGGPMGTCGGSMGVLGGPMWGPAGSEGSKGGSWGFLWGFWGVVLWGGGLGNTMFWGPYGAMWGSYGSLGGAMGILGGPVVVGGIHGGVLGVLMGVLGCCPMGERGRVLGTLCVSLGVPIGVLGDIWSPFPHPPPLNSVPFLCPPTQWGLMGV